MDTTNITITDWLPNYISGTFSDTTYATEVSGTGVLYTWENITIEAQSSHIITFT